MAFADTQTNRRQAARFALRVSASLRERGRARMPIRLIDLSSHGCRIETLAEHPLSSWLWVYVSGLEAQYARVVWRRDRYAGLEFYAPLHEGLLNRVLETNDHLTEADLRHLQEISDHSGQIAIADGKVPVDGDLAALSRDCEVSRSSSGKRVA